MGNKETVSELTWEQAKAQLPADDDTWQTQYNQQRKDYEELCKVNNTQFNPLKDNLYQKPKIPFGPYFASLAATEHGYNVNGAYTLFNTLNKIPDGYIYNGKIKATEVSTYQKFEPIILGQSFDIFGNSVEGEVVIAVSQKAVDQANQRRNRQK